MRDVKILLIEDDSVTRHSLQRVMHKEGYEVLAAEDGYEGLNLFRTEKPDVVVTDLKMPRVDGMEIMYTVKHLAPETDVILITAHGDYNTAITALRQGALDYLKKPVDLEQLIVTLGHARQRVAERRRLAIKTSIMILEDDDRSRENLKRVFEKEGYETFVGADGEEGLHLFSEHKIDILLVDIEMPKVGGMEVLHQVRSLSDDCEIIVITGYGDESTAVQALHDGAINYIRKPIDVDQVLLSVEKATEKLKLRRALLYKARELELAHEIIAKITEEKEIIVELGQNLRIDAEAFASELLDLIPSSILLVDDQLRVAFANRHARESCGASIKQFSPEIIQPLGIEGIGYEDLCKTLRSILSSRVGKLTLIPTASGKQVTLAQVSILVSKRRLSRVLVLVGAGR